jgi:hypothetical protein
MNRYQYQYRTQLPEDGDWSGQTPYDLFVAAYSKSERCQHVYDRVSAKEKHWILFPQFGFEKSEYPKGKLFESSAISEDEYISELVASLPSNLSELSLCIDITAFVRPHLMFLIRVLAMVGVQKFDAIYAEPRQYAKRELTEFSGEAVDDVRQVAGYEGTHVSDTRNDILLIGVGYQDGLITKVAQKKEKAQKLQLFGFPPLRADMYQENVLKVHLAQEALGTPRVAHEISSVFAPANDPFVTASVLSDTVRALRKRNELTNLYLCPLATKAQVLGFALYYVWECIEQPTSVIFPFENEYKNRTSVGVERIWSYTVELPVIGNTGTVGPT